MNKLLVICGPTATGKTSLAINLAKKFNGEIVSADSRQVYAGLDIGTGKDIPPNSKFKLINSIMGGFYLINGVKIWAYDLVDPREDFSVAVYLKIAGTIILDIQKRRKLPILVGGTGLYIKGVVDGIQTADVPRNEELRDKLSGKSVGELFESLSQIDSLRSGSMNSSDKKNPRRLIRAIEVCQYLLDHKIPMNQLIENVKNDTLFIGLTASKDFINKKIEVRVYERIGAGVRNEVKKLIKKGMDWHYQSMMSLGYKQWRDYFEGDVDEAHVVDEWTREEKKYAKRQMTWFKKDKRVNWFDITDKDYPKNVEKLAQKWYHKP